MRAHFLIATIVGISLPLAVWARVPVEVQVVENTLTVTGDCQEDLPIALEQERSGDRVYGSTLVCEEGSFDFADDLNAWNLPVGSYRVYISNVLLPQTFDILPGGGRPNDHPTVSLGSDALSPPVATVDEGLAGGVVRLGQGLDEVDRALGAIEENLKADDYRNDTLRHTLITVMRDALGVLIGFYKDFLQAGQEGTGQNLALPSEDGGAQGEGDAERPVEATEAETPETTAPATPQEQVVTSVDE